MAWTEIFNCDIYGKNKKEANEWWLAWEEPYRSHEAARELPMLKVYPWENTIAHDTRVKHLCGQGCLTKMMDRWIVEAREVLDDLERIEKKKSASATA